MTPSEKLHLQASAYANERKEAYLDRMKQGLVENLSKEMTGWLWVAHFEAYRDAMQAKEQA